MTGLQRPQAQSLLGRFLFSGWDAHEKPVAVLSGGERRRLALAIVVASGANFLVLDEPTNHLDLESREALEAALEAFPGTILLVSHDRALLDAIADRTLAVEDGRLNAYDGGWADYVRRARARRRPRPVPPRAPKTKPRRRRSRGRSARARASWSGSRRRSPAARPRSRSSSARLADDWTNVDTASAHRAARDGLEALLARWEQLFELGGTHGSPQAPLLLPVDEAFRGVPLGQASCPSAANSRVS